MPATKDGAKQQQQPQQHRHLHPQQWQRRWWPGDLSPVVVAAAALVSCAWLLDVGALLRHLLQLTALLAGVATAIYFALSHGGRYSPNVPARPLQAKLPANPIPAHLPEPKGVKQLQGKELSHDLDTLLKEIIEYLIRDCVLPWYCTLAHDTESFCCLLRSDAWIVISKSSELLTKVDWLRFLAVDVVNSLAAHLASVRRATVHNAAVGQHFRLHPCARSSHTETAFLRALSQHLLARLLPATYTKPLRTVMQNVIATAVLKPAVDMLSSPDTYNQFIVGFLSQQEALVAKHKQQYAYSDSYEGFVKMIEKCCVIADLKQFRYDIIRELLHATIVHSVRVSSEKGDQSYLPPSGAQHKVELLKSRNLKVYLNQLKVAKSICERQMVIVGSMEYSSYITDGNNVDPRLGRRSKLVPFASFMQNPEGRNAFLKYMRCCDSGGGDLALLEFWLAIEALRPAETSARYQQAGEIYRKYGRFIQERTTLKAMEAYLIGDSGPDAFFKVQDTLAKQLEERRYASFVVSDSYWSSLLVDTNQGGEVDQAELKSAAAASLPSAAAYDSALGSPADLSPGSRSGDDFTTMELEPDVRSTGGGMKSDILRHKLDDLNKKIFNKSQALQGLRATVKTDDPKYERAILDLDKTLEALQLDRHHLESHKNFDELWWRNIGKWRAVVYGAEVVNEGGKAVLHFVIIVKPFEFDPGLTERSWLILRTLDDCWHLYCSMSEFLGKRPLDGLDFPIEQLIAELSSQAHVLIDRRLEKSDFPPKRLPKKFDDSYIEKAKSQLEAYLARLLKDDHLKHSEPLYHFLCPTPLYILEQLRPVPILRGGSARVSPTAGNSGKLPRSSGSFTIPRLFKKTDDDDDDLLLFLDEDDITKDAMNKSSLLKPLYALVSEIFELHGVFRWFRRTLIHIVQVAYGKSINRQLQEMVAWLVSEPMLVHYLRVFRDSVWPGGCPLNERSVVPRTEEQKALTRKQAQELLVRNIPDVVKNMFGEEAARRSTAKVFEALQDERLNRHLFYVLMESLLQHLTPELAEAIGEEPTAAATAAADTDLLTGRHMPADGQHSSGNSSSTQKAGLPTVVSDPPSLNVLTSSSRSSRQASAYVESLRTWGPQR